MDNKYKAIHETSLGSIIKIWDAIKANAGSIGDIKNILKSSDVGMNASSIAKASSGLTMVFPVLCSRNISIETSSMVTKALEKNAVSMLQRLFASCQVADNANISDFKDYLALFHKNISTTVNNLDDVFNTIDNFKENTNFQEINIIKDDMRNINFVLPDSINETSLTNYIINEADSDNPVKQDRNRNDAANNIKIQKDKLDFFKNQVQDSDYRKANELMPTTMAVNFCISTPNGNVKTYDSALAAVKCKLYPISSEDIINNLSSKIANRNWITQFIRATTREISFVKDFVLAIDKAKIDALSMSDRHRTTDKMWKVLERRALVSRLNKLLRRGDAASVAAITTLVISQEEVEYLRKYYSIDMEKVGTALSLFTSLNLMCICIVDESLEVAKFIYDEEDPMWETISFTHLERESSDNTYKRVVNLMTKVSH